MHRPDTGLARCDFTWTTTFSLPDTCYTTFDIAGLTQARPRTIEKHTCGETGNGEIRVSRPAGWSFTMIRLPCTCTSMSHPAMLKIKLAMSPLLPSACSFLCLEPRSYMDSELYRNLVTTRSTLPIRPYGRHRPHHARGHRVKWRTS